jgi:hypothetical protein
MKSFCLLKIAIPYTTIYRSIRNYEKSKTSKYTKLSYMIIYKFLFIILKHRKDSSSIMV